MRRELEAAIGYLGLVLGWLAVHYNAIITAAAGTTIFLVWLFRLRREWKHRDDKPDND